MTPEEKLERIANLQQLISSRGWQIVQEELDEDIKITEAKLHGEIKLREDESFSQLQRERLDRIELRNLPKNLIKEYSEDNPQEDYEVYK